MGWPLSGESGSLITSPLHQLRIRPEGLIKEPVPEPADTTPEGEKLEGPALTGQGVSQDEIDKMFD